MSFFLLILVVARIVGALGGYNLFKLYITWEHMTDKKLGTGYRNKHFFSLGVNARAIS